MTSSPHDLYVTPLLAGEFMQRTKERATQRDESTRLTERQREILQLLAEGKSAKEIATILNISSRTVKFHLPASSQSRTLPSGAASKQPP